MAQKKISELTAASSLTGTELVPVVQGGTSKRTTTQAIANLGGGGGGSAYTTWNFAGNSDAFPTLTTKGDTIYIAEDDHGVPGDADYVAEGSLMIGKSDGANAYADYWIR